MSGYSLTNKQRGFTLLEVLIALMILATALSALVLATIETNNQAGYLKDKTAAHWVGMNVMASIRVGLIDLSQVTRQTGQSTMLDQTWQWTATRHETDDNYTSEIEVSVAKLNQQSSLHLQGYLSKGKQYDAP